MVEGNSSTITFGNNESPEFTSFPPPFGTQLPPVPVQSEAPTFLRTAKHPTICMLHLAPKLVCLFIFFLGSITFGGREGDYVFTFVLTTLALAIDFWIVKNVSGRLLVGMRWSNQIQEDGTSTWKFEKSQDESSINVTDKTVFWVGVVAWPSLWCCLALFYFVQLRLDWVLLAMIGMVLGGANFVGFWKCSTESRRKVQEFASSALFKSVAARAASFFYTAA